MPPQLALSLWFVLLVCLFRYDPFRSRTSSALWVPLAWMFINGSRLPSQWLGGQTAVGAAAFEEGSPVDRLIYLTLIVMGISIMASRPFDWRKLFTQNLSLMALLALALASVGWSDYPFITFKRWFRDLGNYLMILVVLSDPRPLDAVRTFIRRLSYLLLPLSVVLIKYFPDVGMQYDYWTGKAMFVGATGSKNMLGVICMVSGLYFFWETVNYWHARKQPRIKRLLLVNVVLMGMAVQTLGNADSATSRVCLALGCVAILATHSKMARRHPKLITTALPGVIYSNLFLQFGLGIDLKAIVAGSVGRDPTLTGRTVIWDAVLAMNTNPLVGTGYESFWLGTRLNNVWALTGPGINEAHNGYLEVYLQLGAIGVFLLALFLIASYWSICRRLKPYSPFASLSIAMWAIVIFYNMTESVAFRGQLMWNIFLLAAIVVPHRRTARSRSRAKRVPADDSETILQDAAGTGAVGRVGTVVA